VLGWGIWGVRAVVWDQHERKSMLLGCYYGASWLHSISALSTLLFRLIVSI
jgi:hypothetical protein